MGLFEGFIQESGLSEGYVNEADLAEEMDRLEEMPSADMKSDDIFECYVEAVLANERNYNKIMMSVAHEEMQYFIEHGEEMVYEGTRLNAFFDKIKDLIDRAWQKIKSIFEKALANVNAWISSDKRFVEKYGDKIRETTDVKICRIDDTFDIDANVLKTDAYITTSDILSRYIKALNKGKNAGFGQTSKTDIDKELFKGKTKEEAINDYKKSIGLDEKRETTIKGPEIIEELKSGKRTKSNIKIWYNSAKKAIANMKKDVESAKKEEEKKKGTVNEDSTSYAELSSACTKALSYMHNMQNLQLQAARIYHNNCRKIAARIVSGKVYKESANLEYSSFFNTLD